MAGVYIKGMKMPDNCESCPCLNDEYNYCQVTGAEWFERKTFPPDNCPLVGVPDHGPLVDRNEFIGRQQSWALLIAMGHGDDDEWVKCIGEVCDHLYDAPVVIPADKEDV